MTWTVPPPTGPWYTARLPSGPSVTVTPLARVSPAGKLSVEVAGGVVGSGVSERKPARVAPVIVRLPVTATAPAGTPPRPATTNVRAVFAPKAPARPLPTRVSSRRAGAGGGDGGPPGGGGSAGGPRAPRPPPAGTPPRPATTNVRAVFAPKAPARPLPTRVSS